jgi:hypothetical protein
LPGAEGVGAPPSEIADLLDSGGWTEASMPVAASLSADAILVIRKPLEVGEIEVHPKICRRICHDARAAAAQKEQHEHGAA